MNRSNVTLHKLHESIFATNMVRENDMVRHNIN